MTAAYGMPMPWVPRLGDFDVTEEEIRFKGRRLMLPPPEGSPEGAESKEQASVGLILCNRTLADGFITAEVEFEQITDKTVCELAVAYDPNAAHPVTAGIGGTTLGMFGIREYGSENRRRNLVAPSGKRGAWCAQAGQALPNWRTILGVFSHALNRRSHRVCCQCINAFWQRASGWHSHSRGSCHNDPRFRP